MKLTRAIRSGAPSNTAVAKAMCGRLSSSSATPRSQAATSSRARGPVRVSVAHCAVVSWMTTRRGSKRSCRQSSSRMTTASVCPEEQETRKRLPRGAASRRRRTRCPIP